MLYRYTLIAAVCLALTACSDSATTTNNSSTTTPATEAVATNVAPVNPTAAPPAPAENPANASAPTEAVSLPTVDAASCPYTVEELNQALGAGLSIVNAMEAPFAGGSQLSCQYTGEQPMTVMVNKMTMQDPNLLEGMTQYLADKLEPIPNDPDQAQWNASAEDADTISDLALHYVRSGSSIDIRIVGFEPEQITELKTKLINLRRIP